MAVLLPVVQVKESHELKLDPDTAPPSGFITLAMAPYPRMTAGDRIMLTWQGYFDDGGADEPWTHGQTVSTPGQALLMSLDPGYAGFIANGQARVDYWIDYADTQGGEEQAPAQVFDIVPPAEPRLPAATVAGHSGDLLDPEDFVQGLVLQVAPYPGMQAGDDVLLYATSSRVGQERVLAVRVTSAMIDAGQLLFTLEQGWLHAQLNETVTFDWQYGRPGSAGSSASVQHEVRAAWRPKAPIVVDALPEQTNPAPDQGYIEALALRAGATVRIPEDVELESGDEVQVHWKGFGSSGTYIAMQPVADDPRAFFIPASAVPANMGKRLDVFYTVTRAGGRPATSKPFDLRVVPVLRSSFITVQCACVDAGKLRLACVPATGAQVTLNRWVFMAPGQLVSIQAQGSSDQWVLENVPVTEAHLQAGKISGTLARSYLERLGQGSALSLNVRVSFDEGASYHGFPVLSLVMAQ